MKPSSSSSIIGLIVFFSVAGIGCSAWVPTHRGGRSWSSTQYQRDETAVVSSRSSGWPRYGSITHRPEDTTTTTTTTASRVWTPHEIDTFAMDRGVVMTFTTLGPAYRAVARALHDDTLILGYVEGFVRPAGQILHLDKMQVFQPVVETVKSQVPNSLDMGGVSFGIGLLMGYKCLLHAKEKGCHRAEFLAIDDMEFQHKRLVRYYRRVGFKVVKYVGEDVRDIPDRLVWGGCGTLMKEDVSTLLDKWTKTMELMKSRTEKK